MNRIVFTSVGLLILFNATACSVNKKDRHSSENKTIASNKTGDLSGVVPKGPGEIGNPEENADGSDTTVKAIDDFDSNRIELTKLNPSGSQLRLLTATGLDVVYSRVFSRRTNGQYGSPCGKFGGVDCRNSFFSDTEANDIKSLILTRGSVHFRTPSNLTLNYVKSLRAAVYRECSHLVNTEWAALADESEAKNNKLVTVAGIPPAKNFDSFLRELLAIKDPKIELDSGKEAYHAAFSEISFTKEGAKEANYKDAYTVTCMALAMDPLVFMY